MKFSKVFTRFLLLLALILIIPGMILVAADTKTEKQPPVIVKRGAEVMSMQGTLRRMQDVPQVPFGFDETQRRMRPVKNFERGLKIQPQKGATDGALQLSNLTPTAGLSRRALLMADPYLTFEGMPFVTWGAGWPPDTTGDVGIDHYIQAVNTSFGIFRKSDGVRIFQTTFNNFFGGPGIIGTPCDNQNNGDPIVLFDQYSQRWFILDFAWATSETDGSFFSIAVSETSDPMGNWYQFAMRAHATLMADYPKCGVWHDAIYITANMFDFTPGNFHNVQVWALNKSDLYSGTLTSQFVTDSTYYAWSILPSNAKGVTPPPAGTPNHMIALDMSEWGDPLSADQLVMWDYNVNWTNPALTTWTGPTLLPTANFVVNGTSVPQSGTAIQLDTLVGRLMYPAIYRKYSDHDSMFVNHAAYSGGRWVERWYEVRISGAVPSIFQQGSYAPDANHRWMGSMAADEDGNIALGYSVSASTMNPAIRYTGQASIAATAGQMGLGEKVIMNGTGSQTTYTRWGDYSTMTIDPVDDETFWYTNQYNTTNGTSWHTRIGAFVIKPDLWSQDRPNDTGVEPNTVSSPRYVSEDLWVRKTNDGFVNQFHENPEYGQTNYVYARIRNRHWEGCGIDKVYWSWQGTGLGWPGSWNLIGSQPTGNLVLNDIVILEFPWNPPNPNNYTSNHFCLISRIETSPFAPYGMTVPEGPDIGTNVSNNNNIVWKNLNILDILPNGVIKPPIISVGNLTKNRATVRLDFVARPTNNPLAQKDMIQWGAVDVELGEKLYARWTDGKSLGAGIIINKDIPTDIHIVEAKASVENFILEAGEVLLIKLNFKPFEASLKDTNEYIFDVIQSNFDGKTYKEIGGVRFVVHPKNK